MGGIRRHFDTSALKPSQHLESILISIFEISVVEFFALTALRELMINLKPFSIVFDRWVCMRVWVRMLLWRMGRTPEISKVDGDNRKRIWGLGFAFHRKQIAENFFPLSTRCFAQIHQWLATVPLPARHLCDLMRFLNESLEPAGTE